VGASDKVGLGTREVLHWYSHEGELTTDMAFCAYIRQVKGVIRAMPRGEGLSVEGVKQFGLIFHLKIHMVDS
jgi:hypothetical protein